MCSMNREKQHRQSPVARRLAGARSPPALGIRVNGLSNAQAAVADES